MPKPTSKQPASGTRAPITRAHAMGIAKRLNTDIENVWRFFDKATNNNCYGCTLLSGNTAKKIFSEPFEEEANPPTLKKIIAFVNTSMEKGSGRPWMYQLSEAWFRDPHPDSRFSPAIPDLVLWQDVVEPSIQNEVSEVFAGIYWLYRANGNENTQREGTGVQRELLCIHQPRNAHVRMHLLTAFTEKRNNNVQTVFHLSSGLGYKEGRTLTATLYRGDERSVVRSRTLAIYGPDRGTQKVMKAISTRKSGSERTPYASSAIAVRRDDIPVDTQNEIKAALVDYRTREIFEIRDELPSLFHQAMPGEQLSWETPEVKEYQTFLQKVIRIDN